MIKVNVMKLAKCLIAKLLKLDHRYLYFYYLYVSFCV